LLKLDSVEKELVKVGHGNGLSLDQITENLMKSREPIEQNFMFNLMKQKDAVKV